ncbi:hypothetical protein DENSPDRAFT_839935 [Dentipellis sp. KUC8613]|nr:hypothetical protein DENSPDRAFT_839935 [Dentipellis sp. KUC8613]
MYDDCSWKMTDGYFAVMYGYIYEGKAVSAARVLELMKNKHIEPIPSNIEALRDRSKTDSLGKALACLQITWLMVQCLARTIKHLPMSTLEIGTVGYAFITIAAYIIQWYKPKDIQIPTVLHRGPDAPQPDTRQNGTSQFSAESRRPEMAFLRFGMAYRIEVFVLVITCLLFGGWHCIAWNFTFPTFAELWMWRVCSILSAVPALVFVALIPFFNRDTSTSNDSDSQSDSDSDGPSTVLYNWLAVYLLCRGIVLGLMFIGLRSLPAAVFETIDWTTFFPHL